MSNITLEGIAEVIREELKPVNERLDIVEETLAEHTQILSSHTGALDQLLTEKKTREDEGAIAGVRFDRLEKWGQEVGKKVNIQLGL